MPSAHGLPRAHHAAVVSNSDNGHLMPRCFKDILLPRLRISLRQLSALRKRTSSMVLWQTPFLLMLNRCHSWQNWCRANDLLGPPVGLKQVFAHSYAQHQGGAQGLYRAEANRSIRTKTKAAIWHCENHRARQAVCYCPCLYHQALSGTFENPDISKEPGESFEQQLSQVQKQAIKALSRRYPWAS